MRRPRKDLGYALRNAALKRCGVKSYAEYLSSELWAGIRSRVLARDGGACFLCGRAANEVHHRSYGDVTLRGDKIDKLASVCHGCHQKIELYPDDAKRPFTGTERQISRIKRWNRRAIRTAAASSGQTQPAP